jgi:hypothetical protein
MAAHPDPRQARLLQPATQPERSPNPNPTLDLTIELARVRAAASTMAAALGVIAISGGDTAMTRTAEEALDRAVQMLS